MTYTHSNMNEALIPSQEGKHPNYRKESPISLGICQVVTIVVLFGVSIAGLVLTRDALYTIPMICNLVYCVLYVTTAVLVLVAGRTQKRGVIIASMVLSIITSMVAPYATVWYAFCVGDLQRRLSESPAVPTNYDCIYENNTIYRHTTREELVTELVLCCLSLFSYLALTVLSIWSSSIGCRVTCCGGCCCPHDVHQPTNIISTSDMEPVRATQLVPQGPHVLQDVPAQRSSSVDQHQAPGPAFDVIPEQPHKLQSDM